MALRRMARPGVERDVLAAVVGVLGVKASLELLIGLHVGDERLVQIFVSAGQAQGVDAVVPGWHTDAGSLLGRGIWDRSELLCLAGLAGGP